MLKLRCEGLDDRVVPAIVEFAIQTEHYVVDGKVRYDEWAVEWADPPSVTYGVPATWVPVVNDLELTFYAGGVDPVATYRTTDLSVGEVEAVPGTGSPASRLYLEVADGLGLFGGDRLLLDLELGRDGSGPASHYLASSVVVDGYRNWDLVPTSWVWTSAPTYEAFGVASYFESGYYVSTRSPGPVDMRIDLDWSAVDPDLAAQQVPLSKLWLMVDGWRTPPNQTPASWWSREGAVTQAVADFAQGVLTGVRVRTPGVAGQPPLDLNYRTRPEVDENGDGLSEGGDGTATVTDATTGNTLMLVNATMEGPYSELDFSKVTTGQAYNIQVRVTTPAQNGPGQPPPVHPPTGNIQSGSYPFILGTVQVQPGDSRGKIVDAIHDMLTAYKINNVVTLDGNLKVYETPGAPLAALDLILYKGQVFNQPGRQPLVITQFGGAVDKNPPPDNTLTGPTMPAGRIPVSVNGKSLPLTDWNNP